MAKWLCGDLATWLYACVAARLYGNMAIWLHGSMAVWLHGFCADRLVGAPINVLVHLVGKDTLWPFPMALWWENERLKFPSGHSPINMMEIHCTCLLLLSGF